MYQNNRILVTICARDGSKGIPGKNIKPLAGKPLLAHSIEAAQKASVADRIVVSTDSQTIQRVAQEHGAETPFVRPAKLANDTIGRITAVIHALQESEKHYQEEYDVVLDLGNMSPLRTTIDIMGTLDELIKNPEADLVYTVTPAARNPYYNMIELDSAGFAKMSKSLSAVVSSRQTVPKVYDMNDSIYAIRRDSLLAHTDLEVPIQLESSLKQRVFVMPEERSIDIDRLIDFKLVELLLKEQINEHSIG